MFFISKLLKKQMLIKLQIFYLFFYILINSKEPENIQASGHL